MFPADDDYLVPFRLLVHSGWGRRANGGCRSGEPGFVWCYVSVVSWSTGRKLDKLNVKQGAQRSVTPGLCQYALTYT